MKKNTRRIIALFLAIAMLSVLALSASAESAETVVSSGSQYTNVARMTTEGSETRTVNTYLKDISHTKGTETTKIAPYTKKYTYSATGTLYPSPYSAAFEKLAGLLNVTQSVNISIVGGLDYKIPATAATGTYGFRVVCKGTKIYENVDQTSANGTDSLYHQIISFVPYTEEIEIKYYKQS